VILQVKLNKRDKSEVARRKRRRAVRGLSDETDSTVVDLIGLSEDGGASLLHDLLLGHFSCFVCEVSIANL
jgi:hypothetical protein